MSLTRNDIAAAFNVNPDKLPVNTPTAQEQGDAIADDVLGGVTVPPPETQTMCPASGKPHHVHWHNGAWWCRTCSQKLTSCCEGTCGS